MRERKRLLLTPTERHLSGYSQEQLKIQQAVDDTETKERLATVSLFAAAVLLAEDSVSF